VNGQTAKASKEIKAGDEIEIRRGDKRTVVRVVEVPRSKQVSKNEAGALIDIIEDERLADDPLA